MQENQTIQEFLRLLEENRPNQGKDYSVLIYQMDNMAGQIEAALNELQTVKQQLAEMQENPVKKLVNTIENGLCTMQEQLLAFKSRIVENAKQAVAEFKRTGVSALDKAAAALGVKKGLEAMKENLSQSITELNQSIKKVETIGHELRSAGEHVKNAGRAVTGKEQQIVDGGREGCFQVGILAPMRTEKKLLGHLNNVLLAAIGSLERLEQSAVQSKGQDQNGRKAERQKDTIRESVVAKKPSVRKALQASKAQAETHHTNSQEKQRKPQETAL